MVKEQPTDRQQRLEKFLKSVEAAQKLQDEIMQYGLEAAYLHCDDVESDWLEKWGEDEEEPSYVELLTNFIGSDDAVAVKVRQHLQHKSIPEIIDELEKCLSLFAEEDKIFAVKNLLAGHATSGEINRENSDKRDEISLLDLAESLIDKLTELL